MIFKCFCPHSVRIERSGVIKKRKEKERKERTGKKGETLAANLDKALQIIDDARNLIRKNSWKFPLTAENTPSYCLISIIINTNTHNPPTIPTICVILCHFNFCGFVCVCVTCVVLLRLFYLVAFLSVQRCAYT